MPQPKKRAASKVGARSRTTKKGPKPFGPHRQRPATPRRRPKSSSAPRNSEPRAEGDRLQKFLASAGFGSRRQCEELIEQGRVSIDGKTVTELGTRVDPAKQEVAVDDEPVRRERLVYWWINKPPGYLCTNKDTHGRPTVLDLLPSIKERIYPVGRLDEESTGLILMTNDGEMANRLTHPRYGVPKTYEVLVAGRITNDVIQKLKKGIWLSDGRVRVNSVKRLGTRGDATNLRIVLCEGHNREIRRMFARFEHKVMRLERVAVGPIKIRKLPRGRARQATPLEVGMLRELMEREAMPEIGDDAE